MENYHSSLQLGWPEVSRRLGEGRVRRNPKAKHRVGDDKSPLCVDSGWRGPEAQDRGLGIWFWRRKLVRRKASGRKKRKVRQEGRGLGSHRDNSQCLSSPGALGAL